MIGSLRGTVLDHCHFGGPPRTPGIGGEVLVEVNGVGYRVSVPSGSVAALEPGGPVFLFTHLVVREDAMSLYGFPDREQRDTFEALMGATGVGPKLALAILSAHSPSALRRAVIEGDLDALTLVPGVGKRTAQRLMIELSAKLGAAAPDPALVESGPSGRAEMRAALEGLGYGTDEVRYVLDTLPDDGPVEMLLKEALKLLAADRPAGPKRPVLNGNGKRRA